MTNSPDENDERGGISDDELPEDLQPTDDNPLAQPLEPGEAPDVDLNEASGSYEKQQEGSGDGAEPTDSGD